MSTLKKNLFAANLRGDGKPETWHFSYIVNTKFKGTVAYVPVTSGKQWPINLGSYVVGDGAFIDSKKTVGVVFIDSGTSPVYFTEAVVEDSYSHIKGYELQQEGSYSFPRNKDSPEFHFKTAREKLSTPGRDLNYI